MPSSPFYGFENAKLTFNIPTGQYILNSVGNRVVQTAPVTLLALLKPVKDVTKIQYYIGDDASAELLSGYLVDPLRLPDGIHPPVEGVAEIRTAAGRWEKGKFKVLPGFISSPYVSALQIDFINRVFGVFIRE